MDRRYLNLGRSAIMMNISEHISFKEATQSPTAIRNGIDNTPNDEQIVNMVKVAENIFEPLREHIGNKPIKINSFFRCKKLNKLVGGSKTSQHTKGQAIDLDDSYEWATNAEMFEYIKNNLDFDQLIWEFGDSKNPNWVHVSYVSKKENRNRVLRAVMIAGKTKYLNL